jgi:hypothetical protein
MPADFEKCRQGGGRVRTVSGPNKRFGLKEGDYMHICILGKEIHRGEVNRKEMDKPVHRKKE